MIHSFTQQMFILCLCYVFCVSVQVVLFLFWNVYFLFHGRIPHCSLYYSKHLRFFVRVGISSFTSLISLHYVLHKINGSKYPGSIFLSKQRPPNLAGCIASRLKYFFASPVASCDHTIEYHPRRHLWESYKIEPDWSPKSKKMKKKTFLYLFFRT